MKQKLRGQSWTTRRNGQKSQTFEVSLAPIGYYIEPRFREEGYEGYIKNHFALGVTKIAYYICLENHCNMFPVGNM